MTIATIIIKDMPDGEYIIEGDLDRPEALDEPPTPALIIATYLSANIAKISDEAIAWYNAMGEAK
jgi:hypothetical protein